MPTYPKTPYTVVLTSLPSGAGMFLQSTGVPGVFEAASVTPGEAAWGDIGGTLALQLDLAAALALKAAAADVTAALAGKSDTGHTHAKADVSATGTWTAAEIPGLDAAKITSGTLDAARLPGIKLDDLAAPDDNTDLNATASAHGLLPKLSGNAAHVLKGDGTFGAPAGGGHNAASAVQVWRSVTMTNIGTAYKDIYSGTAFDEEHLAFVDFTGVTQVRMVFLWDYVGAGTQQVRLVDLANNANVLVESATFTADQDPGDTGWVDLPAAFANATKRLEWQGKSTTAGDDPVAKGYILYVR